MNEIKEEICENARQESITWRYLQKARQENGAQKMRIEIDKEKIWVKKQYKIKAKKREMGGGLDRDNKEESRNNSWYIFYAGK